MARFGGMTALRAALGGVAGGLEGLGAMREEQRLIAEQERQRQRQAMLDERQMRAEQREALNAGGIMSNMDMPGATPRTGVMRQTIGDQEFMFEPQDVQEHRAAVRKRLEQGKQPDRLQWSDKFGGFVNLTTGKFSKASGLPSIQSEGGGLTANKRQAIRDEEAEAEAVFNTMMSKKSPLRAALTSAYQDLRQARPTARPQELMRAALAAARAIRVPLEPRAPGGSRASSSAQELDRDLKAAGISLSSESTRRGVSPSASPAPAAKKPRMNLQQEAEIARQMREEGYDDAYISEYLNELRGEFQ